MHESCPTRFPLNSHSKDDEEKFSLGNDFYKEVELRTGITQEMIEQVTYKANGREECTSREICFPQDPIYFYNFPALKENLVVNPKDDAVERLKNLGKIKDEIKALLDSAKGIEEVEDKYDEIVSGSILEVLYLEQSVASMNEIFKLSDELNKLKDEELKQLTTQVIIEFSFLLLDIIAPIMKPVRRIASKVIPDAFIETMKKIKGFLKL